MGKLPMGGPNPHVQKSRGGDSDVMKFYCTQNETTFGKKFTKFEPRPGRHTGTGYLSNFRPGVYYSEKLDHIDNPTVGRIVQDNYHTITERSFQPYKGASGTEPLPDTCKQAGSGFVRQAPLNIPTDNEVKQVFIDSRVASAPAEIMPHYTPRLHSLKPKDPVELENSGYGPSYMKSETAERYRGHQPNRLNLLGKTAGPKEDSGFTHAYNVEPVTFQPNASHGGNVPAFLTHRPTGVSVMKTHYRPSEVPNGAESLPAIAARSDHDTGFTNGTKAKPGFVHRNPLDAYDKAADIPGAKLDRMMKRDPAEYMNATNPNNQTSMTAGAFKGQQLPDKSEAGRLGRAFVGDKEGTGFSANNDRFLATSDNPQRFITHYNTRFLDRTAKGVDCEGHTWGGVQPQKVDGFTRSTNVHSNGPDFNSTSVIRNLEPYVARSIKARDVFYDDHTYDSKLQSGFTKSALPQAC